MVDSESTDNTVEIAEIYTKKVFINPWSGYSDQKKYALSKASNDWVLSIDADERVTPELQKELKLIVQSAFLADFSEKLQENQNAGDRQLTVNGFKIPFIFYFFNHRMRFGGCGNERHLRFFRKDKGRFDAKFIHEGIAVEGKIGRLKNYILHY